MILVTGGCGYIGSHVVFELLKNKKQIIVVDDLSNSNLNAIKNLQEMFYPFNIEIVDITNLQQFENIFLKYNISQVIHLAAKKSVGQSMADPEDYYFTNVVGTLNLIKLMKKYQVKKCVFSGSATVYTDLENAKETDPVGYCSIYGHTKLICEEILRNCNIPTVVLRYFNPVGFLEKLTESPKKAENLFPVIQNVLEKKLSHLIVYSDDYSTSDGTCVRDYVHVIDVAKAHILALEYSTQFDIFNIGLGKGVSVLQIIKKFKNKGVDIPFLIGPRRSGDSEIVYANNDKAKKILGWEPSYTLDDIIDCYT